MTLCQKILKSLLIKEVIFIPKHSIIGNSLLVKNLFKVCYPKSFKNTNKFSVSTLLIMVQRGHEVELEYSKKEIMDRMNAFFKDEVVKRIKFTSFNDENKIDNQKIIQNKPVTNNKYKNKLNDVKNEEIKNSLIELTKVFKEK